MKTTWCLPGLTLIPARGVVPSGFPSSTTLLGGLVSLAAGIVTFMMPGLTALTLLTLIAIWAVMRGVFEIVAAIRLRKEIKGEWLMALAGALSIAFGLYMIAFPGAGAVAVVWWIGAYAVAIGLMLVMLGFRARGLAHRAA